MKKFFSLLVACTLVVASQAQLVNVVNQLVYTDGDDPLAAQYPAGHDTWRVVAQLADGVDKITAVYAEADNSLTLGTDGTGFIWNSTFGGTIGTDLNPAFFPVFPSAQWDSMVTIGRENSGVAGSSITAVSVLPSATAIQDIFNAAPAAAGNLVMQDGTWFTTPDGPNSSGVGVLFEVTLAQITKPIATDLAYQLNVQVLDGGQGGTEIKYVWDSTAATEPNETYFPALEYPSASVPGCTDLGSCNYNAAATSDDGSCDGGATGCDVCVGGPDDGTGSIQDNPEVGEACDDGDAGTMMDTVQADCSCAGVVIVNGCTSAASCNYNAAANVDDGSCDGGATGCDVCVGGPDDGTGSIQDNPEVGEACDDGDAGTMMDTVQADCSCAGVVIVNGCTSAASCNYNAAANVDDGSCDGGATGCDVCVGGPDDGTGSIQDNPEPGEACDDGDAGTMMDTTQADCSCVGVTIVNGCTDAGSCNYNVAANVDDGSCDGGATGCDVCVGGPDDGTGSIQDNPEPGEACDDGDAGTMMDTTQADCSCAGTPIVNGCTDAGSCNYNAAANVDDGSCDGGATGCDVCVGGPDDGTGSIQDNPEPGEACDDGDAGTMMDTTQADCSCVGTPIVNGCTDAGSCNYNMAANVDDGSCDGGATGCDACSGETDGTGTIIDNPEPGEACDDGLPGTINDTTQPDCSCVGIGVVPGCMDAGSCNYNVNANQDDGSCDGGATGCDVCSGETDGTGSIIDNPEPGEACDDGDAGTMMDTTQADCSCVGVTIVNGCTDAGSCNYNAAANVDDGSCDGGATGCDVCVGGPDDGTGSIQDNPEPGEACDDGDAGTMMDTTQADCSCVGVTIVNGCTDAGSCNYNVAANVDDGSCDGGATGCDVCVGGPDDGTGSIQDNPEPGEACDDGDAGTMMDTTQADCSCAGTPIVNGCTDAGSCNYNAAANVDDGSCDGGATGCDVCVGGPDDGTGSIQDNPEPGEACDDGDAGTMMDTTQADCSCVGTPIVNGCTDAGSCNYNMAANVDDGSCDGGATGCDVCSGETDGSGTIIDNPEVGEACDDGDAGTFDDTVQADCSCAGTPVVNGCTDGTATNFDPAANTEDGSCLYLCATDPMDLLTVANAFSFDDGSGNSYGSPSGMGLVAGGNNIFGGHGWSAVTTGLLASEICINIDYTVTGDPLDFPKTLEFRIENNGTADNNSFNLSVPGPGTYNLGGIVSSGVQGGAGFNPEGAAPTIVAAIAHFEAAPINGNMDVVFSNLCVSTACGVAGCTDVGATNFDPAATTDDGSCLYDVTLTVDMNCFDGFDPNIETDGDGTFTQIDVEGPSFGFCGGCVPMADNGDGTWSVTLNIPAGNFEYKYAHDGFAGQENLIDDMVGGASCAPVTDFFSFANRLISVPTVLNTSDVYGSCGSCDPGCTDVAACNYDSAANFDDGSCVLATGCDTCSGETDGTGVVVDNPEVGEACDDGDAGTTMDTIQADCSCAGVPVVNGCTDGAACNFDPTANVDDGSCILVGDACDDGDALTFNDQIQEDCSCAGSVVALPQSKVDYPSGDYDLCDLIKADWVDSDDYRFVFVAQSDGTTIIVEQGGPNTFLQLKTVGGLIVGETYDVTVDALFGAVWSIGTVVKNITVVAPTVVVNPADNCSNHGPHFLGDYISGKPFVCGADKWEWSFTPVGGGLPIVYTRNSSNRFVRLSWVTGLMPGSTYDVTVRAGYPNGAFTGMSAIECIEIVGTAPSIGEGPIETEFLEVEREVAEPTAAIYPNPNSGDFLNVNLTGVENSKVTIDIVSTFGSFVDRIELNVANGSVNEVVNLNGLASGVYLVNITMDDTVVTERLVVQK